MPLNIVLHTLVIYQRPIRSFNSIRVNVSRCVLWPAGWHVEWVCDHVDKVWELSDKGIASIRNVVSSSDSSAFPMWSTAECYSVLTLFLSVHDTCKQSRERCLQICSYSRLSLKPKRAAKLPLYYQSQKIDFSLPRGCARSPPRFLLSDPRLWSNGNSSHS